MINSIKNGDQPLPRVTQVSIAGTSSTEQPPLKGKSMWKAAVLYEYETFKATEEELLLDTYIRYLQVINDLKNCGYSKDNCELNFKFLNNLQPEWKQYATMMRQNRNLMHINIDALYNILKQNQGDVNDAMGSKKKTVVVTSDPLDLIAEKTKVSKSKEKVVVSSDSEGTLSPSYVVDSDPEKDQKDPTEDPAYYPADRGNNDDDDESSNDDDNDDDVEKDDEDKEEEERLAPADPSDVSTDDLETMTTVNQRLSIKEIEQVVAQRVANAIEAIAIYEAKTNLTRMSMSQTERQEEEVVENASNKRKWESNHNGSLSQQNKGHKANTTNIQKGTGANQKATCYDCGNQGHYRRDCPEQKNQNQENQIKSTKAHGVVHAFGGGET
nr:hypothetical protein [Tanacetum cinerariifolium]